MSGRPPAPPPATAATRLRISPAFGPFGITDAPLQTALSSRLYDELARGPVALGEAIRRAKARAVDEEPASVPVVEGWNLLGDPSLPLALRPPRPAGR